jgi:hypothetical protein
LAAAGRVQQTAADRDRIPDNNRIMWRLISFSFLIS